MSELKKIREVTPLEGHWLRVSFTDGAVMEIDLGHVLAAGGVFAEIRDRRDVFEQVRVNPETETVEWPGEIDLDPDVLYGSFEPASGERIERRIIEQPERAHA